MPDREKLVWRGMTSVTPISLHFRAFHICRSSPLTERSTRSGSVKMRAYKVQTELE